MSNDSDAKKRRLDKKQNDAVKSCSPIVNINVGGANRNVRRSLLNKLHLVSHDNPLCVLLLQGAHHWSDVPTTMDQDGTVRIYLDRNPNAFDDLLEYVEYGKEFLEPIIKNDNEARLRKLRLECDYFTIDSFAADVDKVMFGEPVHFRSDSWFKISGRGSKRNGWDWRNTSGNQSIASQNMTGLGICKVETTATYLLFFSLHSIATPALPPNHGYTQRENDELCKLGVLPGVMNRYDSHIDVHTIGRCGAFDYRSDKETRMNNPLLCTASFSEPISLRTGNMLYCEHGTLQGYGRIGAVVVRHSDLADEPECTHFIKLVRVFGDSIEKWSVKREEGEDHHAEPTRAKWMVCRNDFNNPNCMSSRFAHVDDEDSTMIRFRKAGYYLLLGRVAGTLKKNCKYEDAAIKLELRTNGGTPVHISHNLVSYPGNSYYGPEYCVPYEKRRVDYGHINDVIYAESESFLQISGFGGACIAQHGTVPDPFDKIPTQSLSATRLAPSVRVDRYQVLFEPGSVMFERALGSDERTEQESLFNVVSEGSILEAYTDCQCIVVGSLSHKIGSIATLKLSGNPIIHSQLCEDTGYGSHNISTVIQIEEEECLEITSNFDDDGLSHSGMMGCLAFVVLA